MTSKRRKRLEKAIQERPNGVKECMGCCYKVNSLKDFEAHLKAHKCEQVTICDKCEIFRTINSSMYDEHREDCTGTKHKEKEPPKKKKKKQKVGV